MKPVHAYGYFCEEPNAPFQKREFTVDELSDGDVLVEVSGCGLCHTDISFYTGQVKTNQSPVILGHEISGTIVATGSVNKNLDGQRVVVPAVLPCGDCDLCRQGRSNICRKQLMPGNDFNGGFASHVVVPGRFLCPLPKDLGSMKLQELSVIADAVTTPYQSLLRSGFKDGDLAVVIGVGGIGTYMVQHAKNAGGRVIALDISDDKLANAQKMGAEFIINTTGLNEGEVKKSVRGLVKEHGLPKHSWKVFETSGTAAGQSAAFALLSFAGVAAIVGFTMDSVNVRLSNAMAFDATIVGNWGCAPEHYPAVVSEVLAGRINVRDNVEERPLDSINEVLQLALSHKLDKRVIFTP